MGLLLTAPRVSCLSCDTTRSHCFLVYCPSRSLSPCLYSSHFNLSRCNDSQPPPPPPPPSPWCHLCACICLHASASRVNPRAQLLSGVLVAPHGRLLTFAAFPVSCVVLGRFASSTQTLADLRKVFRQHPRHCVVCLRSGTHMSHTLIKLGLFFFHHSRVRPFPPPPPPQKMFISTSSSAKPDVEVCCHRAVPESSPATLLQIFVFQLHAKWRIDCARMPSQEDAHLSDIYTDVLRRALQLAGKEARVLDGWSAKVCRRSDSYPRVVFTSPSGGRFQSSRAAFIELLGRPPNRAELGALALRKHNGVTSKVSFTKTHTHTDAKTTHTDAKTTRNDAKTTRHDAKD
eukprot:5475241-Pleurochrysis_carterae.AAC.1